jgi:hypothetical protein
MEVEVGDVEDGRAAASYRESTSSPDAGRRGSYIRVDLDTEPSSSISPLKDVAATGQKKDHGLGRGGGKEQLWWGRQLSSRLPTLSILYRNILKCSLAYFLGSLFTYYSPLARFIAELTQDSPGEQYPSAMGHMVATV